MHLVEKRKWLDSLAHLKADFGTEERKYRWKTEEVK